MMKALGYAAKHSFSRLKPIEIKRNMDADVAAGCCADCF